MDRKPTVFATGQTFSPAQAQQRALAWLHTARFQTTAAQLSQLPRTDVPEIAFVGRSNAGKSTAINTLCQQRQLAFASRKPGRTQHINLFSLGHSGAQDAAFADLPGYGYAAVPQADKLRWQRVMLQYLLQRDNLRALVVLCDSRLGLTELDLTLLDALRPRVENGLRFMVLLTKVDKLNRSEQNKALSIARLNTAGGDVQLFSALKRIGVETAAQWLWECVQMEKTDFIQPDNPELNTQNTPAQNPHAASATSAP